MDDPDIQEDAQSKPTHEEICLLPHAERMRYVKQMRVRYPLWETILGEIGRRHRMREIAADTQRLRLVGSTGAGKTTLATSYARKYPAIFTETVILRPVVMATIPSTASVANLLIALLSALGDPGAARGSIGAR